MASKTKTRPRTKSKQQRDEVHEDTGLGPDEDSHEEQGEHGPDDLVTKIEQILDVKLANLKNDLATKQCISSLRTTILEQAQTIEKLEARTVILESYIKQIEKNAKEVKHLSEDQFKNDAITEQLEKRVDDMEQYQRRLCLRINGIPCANNESAEDCLQKVKSLVKNDLKVDVPDLAFDRAHRIGQVSQETENGKTYQSIIVRFTTWRHRTIVFRARKNTRKVRIKLDLTRKRIKLLEQANDLLDETDGFFAMADVNCRLCLKLDDGFHYFETETDLKELLKYV